MKLATSITCTACMACVDSCRHGALSFFVDRDGFYQIDTDKDQCVECGLCEKACPVLNPLPIERDRVEQSMPYAVWCTDEVLRHQSASGGAFAAIAKAFLEEGGVVYGAAINGFEIHHRRIDRIEEVSQILGSKYQHSKMDGVYRQVSKDLGDGRTVLFSGLSCQVAGVLKFIPPRLQTNLFTIDTICGGLSTMLPMTKLKETGNYTGIHSFRNKDNGWKSKGFKYALKMYKKDGSINDLGKDNMVIQCFCHKETKRLSCFDCQFNGFHRGCDATIGDFWGDTRFAEQHNNGLSVLIIHSSRIQTIIHQSLLHTEPITWKELVGSNPNVYWSHHPYLIKSLTRKRVFKKLRDGKEISAKRILDDSLLKRVETFVFLRRNELERKSYLSRIMKERGDI